MNRFVAIICVFFLTGCASNAFNEFYEGQSAIGDSNYIIEDEIHVATLPDMPFEKIAQEMFAHGYDFIGMSSWEGPGNQGNNEAIEQAKKVGASYVLWTSTYVRTKHGIRPITTYNPGRTATTFHSGGINSGGMFGTYSGTSTTYLPGSVQTQYVPYSVDRYNYTGLFFAKIDTTIYKGRLGIALTDPGDDYKRKFDTHYGQLVIGVLNDSNAYRANIFVGDIIMSVNGIPFDGKSNIPLKYGEENIIKIYRDGNILEKKIVFDNI